MASAIAPTCSAISPSCSLSFAEAVFIVSRKAVTSCVALPEPCACGGNCCASCASSYSLHFSQWGSDSGWYARSFLVTPTLQGSGNRQCGWHFGHPRHLHHIPSCQGHGPSSEALAPLAIAQGGCWELVRLEPSGYGNIVMCTYCRYCSRPRCVGGCYSYSR